MGFGGQQDTKQSTRKISLEELSKHREPHDGKRP